MGRATDFIFQVAVYRIISSFQYCTDENRFSGTEQAIKDHIQRVQTIAKQWKGGEFQFAKTEEDKIVLWSARKEALWAMLAQRPPGTEIWSTDCAVPMSRLAEIIGKLRDLPSFTCTTSLIHL